MFELNKASKRTKQRDFARTRYSRCIVNSKGFVIRSLSFLPISLPIFLILKSCYVIRVLFCSSSKINPKFKFAVFNTSKENDFEKKRTDVAILWFRWKMMAEIERKGACYTKNS